MLIDTLKTLCGLFGPSGCEDEVRDYIRREAEPYADEIVESPHGDLLVLKRGRIRTKHTIMLAAHMDEVGLIIRSVGDEGFLRFACVGGIDRRVILGRKVLIGEKRIPGIIGMKPIHLTTQDDRESIPKVKDLYIDIGARSKEEAEARVEPGDYACFLPGVTELQNGHIRSKAIDDRIGCAVLLETLKEDLPVDAWFVFTVQEEIGSRGAFGTAFALKPDIGMILEGTSAADAPQAKDAQQVCATGKGPVLSLMDRGAIYDRGLFRLLQQIAEEKGTGWQIKTRVVGSTDARAMQRSQGGCKVAGISAPVRYIHSPSCVGNVKDFEAMKVLVLAFLEKMEDYHG